VPAPAVVSRTRAPIDAVPERAMAEGVLSVAAVVVASMVSVDPVVPTVMQLVVVAPPFTPQVAVVVILRAVLASFEALSAFFSVQVPVICIRGCPNARNECRSQEDHSNDIDGPDFASHQCASGWPGPASDPEARKIEVLGCLVYHSSQPP